MTRGKNDYPDKKSELEQREEVKTTIKQNLDTIGKTDESQTELKWNKKEPAKEKKAAVNLPFGDYMSALGMLCMGGGLVTMFSGMAVHNDYIINAGIITAACGCGFMGLYIFHEILTDDGDTHFG